MRKRIFNMIAVTMVFCFLMVAFGSVAQAGDQLLEAKIESMAVRTDKNGNEYVRFIIKEDRSINGVAYKADTVVMAFGTQVEPAKKLSEGGQLKAVCSQNEYQGRKNYNIIQIL